MWSSWFKKMERISLPKNVVSYIFNYLDAKEICTAARVSKTWNRASQTCEERQTNFLQKKFKREPLFEFWNSFQINAKIFNKKRWRELLWKDFGEYGDKDPHEESIKTTFKYILERKDLRWKEKYSKMTIFEKREKVHKEIFGINRCNEPPTHLPIPSFDPFLACHESKKGKELTIREIQETLSLLDFRRYLEVTLMHMFNPEWLEYYMQRLKSAHCWRLEVKQNFSPFCWVNFLKNGKLYWKCQRDCKEDALPSYAFPHLHQLPPRFLAARVHMGGMGPGRCFLLWSRHTFFGFNYRKTF